MEHASKAQGPRAHIASGGTRSNPAAMIDHARLSELAQLMNASPAVQRLQAVSDNIQGKGLGEEKQVQMQSSGPATANNTGLPDNLKSGIESLSGLSMDHVRVHRNSSRPAQLNAHAFAQGADIHLAPGQEQHLPHEAWHVVQQAQGRVKPTMQMQGGQMQGGVPVNDDPGLEQEADVMGARAAATATPLAGERSKPGPIGASQMKVRGGYDGSNIYLSDGASAAVVQHELGHAVANHQVPSGRGQLAVGAGDYHLDGAREHEADVAGARVGGILGPEGLDAVQRVLASQPRGASSRNPMLPYLTEDNGSAMPGRRIDALIHDASYKHGEPEGGRIGKTILAEQENGDRAISLPGLIDELSRGDKVQKRTGYLLGLMLHANRPGSEGNPEDQAWVGMATATSLIFDNASLLNQDRVPPDFQNRLEKVSADKQQWHAATVTALRTGGLNVTGFQALGDLLNQTLGIRINDRSPDLQHEFALKAGKREQREIGQADKPNYEVDDLTNPVAIVHHLNSKIGLTDHSGKYQALNGIIYKTLDLGHKAVDLWESVAHRNEHTVGSKSDFTYLALLSPTPEGEVVGANGKVLSDGNYMFTVDSSFRFRYMQAANFVGEGGVNKNFVQYIPHAQLMAQKNVAAAGNFAIAGGKFVWIDNGSGHYRVAASINNRNLTAALHALGYSLAGVRLLDRGAGHMDAHYRKGNEILDVLPGGRPAITEEIRRMEDVMNHLAALAKQGPQAKAESSNQISEDVEMVENFVKKAVRLAPEDIVVDKDFGQSQRMLEAIGDDDL